MTAVTAESTISIITEKIFKGRNRIKKNNQYFCYLFCSGFKCLEIDLLTLQ